MSKFFGKVKNAFTWENVVDFVVGGYFDKDDEYELDFHY